MDFHGAYRRVGKTATAYYHRDLRYDIVIAANWTEGFAILPAAQVTLFEAMGGLVLGTVLGVTTAFVVSRFPASRDTVLPLAIAINAIPIIAFAPRPGPPAAA